MSIRGTVNRGPGEGFPSGSGSPHRTVARRTAQEPHRSGAAPLGSRTAREPHRFGKDNGNHGPFRIPAGRRRPARPLAAGPARAGKHRADHGVGGARGGRRPVGSGGLGPRRGRGADRTRPRCRARGARGTPRPPAGGRGVRRSVAGGHHHAGPGSAAVRVAAPCLRPWRARRAPLPDRRPGDAADRQRRDRCRRRSSARERRGGDRDLAGRTDRPLRDRLAARRCVRARRRPGDASPAPTDEPGDRRLHRLPHTRHRDRGTAHRGRSVSC